MPNLVIDIGNSYIKTAIFSSGELVWVQRYADIDKSRVDAIIAEYGPQKAIVATVTQDNAAWLEHLALRLPLVKFSANMATAVNNHYRTPQTLGLDRLAAVIGANAIYPQQANLVIDAGTCITYDGIDAQANYYGGSISPGLNMRYQALNHFTARLPLLEADADFADAIGYDTTTAIRSGVQNGIKYEVTGFIEQYFNLHPKTNIILTGGDANFFDTLLKNSIFAPHIKIEPHLVLKGLNAVIQHHND